MRMRINSKKQNPIRKTCNKTLIFALVLVVVGLVLAVMERKLTPSLWLANTGDSIGAGQSAKVGPCHANPYFEAYENPSNALSLISEKVSAWKTDFVALSEQLFNVSHGDHNWKRFDAFPVFAPCTDTSCLGGACGQDSSKIVCGLQHLKQQQQQDKQCVVYSIGGNNNWDFERALQTETPCEIHTFDCTGPPSRFTPPADSGDRIHFHHICLGTVEKPAQPYDENTPREQIVGEILPLSVIQKRLNHTHLDLLKMDIEGYEWPVMQNWYADYSHDPSSIALPMQVLVEVHYRTQMPELAPHARMDFKNELDFMDFSRMMLNMGYTAVYRDDNVYCAHCTELTLLRYQC